MTRFWKTVDSLFVDFERTVESGRYQIKERRKKTCYSMEWTIHLYMNVHWGIENRQRESSLNCNFKSACFHKRQKRQLCGKTPLQRRILTWQTRSSFGEDMNFRTPQHWAWLPNTKSNAQHELETWKKAQITHPSSLSWSRIPPRCGCSTLTTTTTDMLFRHQTWSISRVPPPFGSVHQGIVPFSFR